MRAVRLLVASTVVLALAGPQAEAKITVAQPKAANAVNKSTCPAKDGENELEPVPVTYLAPASTKGLMNELKTGDTKFASPPWTFKKGAALNGTLTVDAYKSKFRADHFSGGLIQLRYVRGKGDPENLRWVQLIATDGPLNKAKSPYIDPFPNDDPKNKDLPFYYTEKEIKDRAKGKNKFGAYDLRFYDFSKRRHPPTSNVTWTADLYLASWDGKRPGTITIHDGIRWGWKAGCKKAKPAAPAVPSGASIPSDGSRMVLTGTVSAGEETTLTAVDPQGTVLTGVVVEIVGEDEEYVTDDDGRVTFTVPVGVPHIETRLRDLPEGPIVKTPVEELPPGWDPAQPPVISDAPSYPMPGTDITIVGGPFDGTGVGNVVTVGDGEMDVRACSPTEIVFTTPADFPVGDHGPLTVATDHGVSAPWDMTFLGLAFESADTLLTRGQKGKGVIVITGTTERLKLSITNLTPGIITLKGGSTIIVRTSGGTPNKAKIRYTGVSVGDFQLDAEVVD